MSDPTVHNTGSGPPHELVASNGVNTQSANVFDNPNDEHEASGSSDIAMLSSELSNPYMSADDQLSDNDMAGYESNGSDIGFDLSKLEDFTAIEEDDFDLSKLEDFNAMADVGELDQEDMEAGLIVGPDESDESSSEDDHPELEDNFDMAVAQHHRTSKIARKGAVNQNSDSSSWFLLEDPAEPEIPSAAMGLRPNIVNNPNVRKIKVSGGLLAYAKKVTAELDSDDELIVSMKEQGYSDGQVSDRLRSEGRIQYNRKTINTRFQRIRFAQAKRVDDMLLEGYKEWQYEDDILLMKAKDLADAEIEDTIKRLRLKRFDKVSDYMHKLSPEAIFSSKACKERYIGLVNGTASIPIELDDNPQKRREELQAYQESREKARELAKKEKAEKDAAERLTAEAAKLVHAEKAAEAARKRQLNAEYKARREQEKAEKKLHGFKKADEIRKKRDEKAEHKKLAGSDPKGRSSATLLSIKTLDTITPATPDPRAALSLQQLKALCAAKSLSKEGRSKAEFVERLKAMDQKLTLAELKRMSALKGLNTSANKTNLIHQLAVREVDNIKKDAAAQDKAGPSTRSG